ncbi:hypothetical protein BE221DRAFT_193562 [Ostreococcus tauri]|uniref:Uncharacterized protein n=1 Tax=Ostreococcus tauri TaxID=70448 RepID=A0A1Y5I635_OSTTA|nr:hypothetical protein BE221DRAFT_193562 [Ostreococcus tauri]
MRARTRVRPESTPERARGGGHTCASVSTASRRARRACARVTSTNASSRAKDKICILPGLGNASGDYDALAALFRARGHAVAIAPVSRVDWLRNAAGAVTAEYWRGTLAPRPFVDWYLERIERACGALDDERGDAIALVAHSAGGWLARVYVDAYATDARARSVGKLVTLGSPMKPVDASAPGVIDQTRGILNWVEENCRSAEAYETELGIEVTCVAGTYARGSEDVANVAAFGIGLGYKMVCGKADVEGDGITPCETAIMDGARGLILPGVYHTPLGSSTTSAKPRAWYGSEKIFNSWVRDVFGE